MYGQFQAAAPRRVLQIPSAVLHRPTALCALVPVYYSLSKHFSYYPVVNTLTFLPHFVNEKFKRPVGSHSGSGARLNFSREFSTFLVIFRYDLLTAFLFYVILENKKEPEVNCSKFLHLCF